VTLSGTHFFEGEILAKFFKLVQDLMLMKSLSGL
jgi:hypothetical protein